MEKAITASKPLALDKKLEKVFAGAAKLLPHEVGQQLMAFATPAAFAALATIVTAWAVAHFFGVGEVADLLLLVAGYAALGGIAIEAATHIADCIKLTINSSTDKELDAASKHLATAITLVGVQSVMIILFRKRPGDTFKTVHGKPLKPYKQMSRLPRGDGMRYKPKLIFTRTKNTGIGKTDPLGNSQIGRAPGGKFSHGPNDPWRQELRAAVAHEKVHQFFSPKFYLLREIRIYAKQSAYARSFLLRYIEEALAETIGLLRGSGWTRENVFKGLIFPLNGKYTLTISQMRAEARGILLGPVIAAGMMFNAFYGLSVDE